MGNINSNWPRWVFASVSKHFQVSTGLPVFIEGQHRDTRKEKDFIEVRMDGPQFTEVSKGYWKIYGEVNILVTSAMDTNNYHRIHQSVGLVAAAFTMIHLFKYGTGVDDDQSHWGCWNLLQDTGKRQRIDIFHFGKVDVKSEIVQASVEGHYETSFKEN